MEENQVKMVLGKLVFLRAKNDEKGFYGSLSMNETGTVVLTTAKSQQIFIDAKSIAYLRILTPKEKEKYQKIKYGRTR